MSLLWMDSPNFKIKSFWINGEFKYYVATKAADKVEDPKIWF